jgi:hypothetical protein
VTAGVGRTWEAGGAHAGLTAGKLVRRGGWLYRPAHWLIRPLGPGDGPMTPSPKVMYNVLLYIHIIYVPEGDGPICPSPGPKWCSQPTPGPTD